MSIVTHSLNSNCKAFCIALFLAVGTFALSPILETHGTAFANAKYAGIVVDAKIGQVLYSDQADEKRYPASLTKIMTLYILFEEIEAGNLSLRSPLMVSTYAAAQAPSKLWLKNDQTIRVRDACLGGKVSQ